MSSRVIESLLPGPAAPRAVEPAPRAAEERRGFGSALDQALHVEAGAGPPPADSEFGDCDLPAHNDDLADEALQDEAESPEDETPTADEAAVDVYEQSLVVHAPPVPTAVATAGVAALNSPTVSEPVPQTEPAADASGQESTAIPSMPEPNQPRDQNGAIAADAAMTAAEASAPVTTAFGAQARKALADDGNSTSEEPIAEDGGEAAASGSTSDDHTSGAATSKTSQSSDQLATTATTHGVSDGDPASVDDGDPAAIGPQGDSAPTIVAAAADPAGSPAGAGGEATPIEHAADDAAAPSAPAAGDSHAGANGNAAPLTRLTSGRTLTSIPQRGEAGTVEHVDRDRFLGRVEGAIRTAQQRDGRVQVRLSPPELGSLRIELTIEQGVLSARLEAETPAARKVLLDNLPALRERLAQQDVRVDRFDVDVRREGGGSSGGPQDRPAGDPAPRQGDERRERAAARQAASVGRLSAPALKTTADGALDVRV